MAVPQKRVMPLATEKRPANPVPKGPPPDTLTSHQVHDKETFESVAQKHGVPVDKLILHNFKTLDPGELNWYLREYVGCDLPTHDRKNWRFSNSANPGLIYVPKRVIRLDPIYLDITKPIDLNTLVGPDFPASKKFVYVLPKIPPKPAILGHLQAQGSVTVEGELKPKKASDWKVSFKKDQVKLAVEQKINADLKATFAAKFDKDSIQPMIEAIAKGSKEDFFKALFKPFEVTLKKSIHWGNFSLEPEVGGEISSMPLLIRVTGGYENDLISEGTGVKGKFAVKLGLNVGPSPQGWAWIAENVGQPVLRVFLEQGGRVLVAVGEWLVSEAVLTAGVVVVGTVVGTIALVSLCAWIVQDANHKGEMEGIATWYIAAYRQRVFDRPYSRPTGFIVGDAKLRDQLVLLGEKDALLDARAILKKQNHPAARGTDQQALDAYRMLLLGENQLNEDRARVNLRNALMEKSRKLVGL